MTSTITPVFIFSLPRSGSTLLQRLLATHNEITTVAEPWLLIPAFYSLRKQGITAEYNHASETVALNEFFQHLPNGKADYLVEIKKMVLNLYQLASKEKTRYFLDKTPRYHVISADIIELFPEAKFIILYRNPLAIIASMIETWKKGQWKLSDYEIDIYAGLTQLVNTAEKYPDKVLTINYEELVTNSTDSMKRIFSYLQLDYNESILDDFSETTINGRMGDKTGYFNYKAIDSSSLEIWKQSFSNPIRQYWAKNYIHWLGKQRLQKMGYDDEQLLQQVSTLPKHLKGCVNDISDILSAKLFKQK